ncbi:MAG TPA: hypothetical protein VGT40_14865 [Methylomirabilota bacterium]|jgi:hypothetical protein|nr:hypothetical protein [Methylomirabilota bacterium]
MATQIGPAPRWLIVALLAMIAFSETLGRASRTVAPDFYQLWAVSAAVRADGVSLGSPYKDSRGYWAILTRQAETSADPRRKAVHKLWPNLSPVASPFLFVLFALLPADYTTAATLFASLQAVMFLAAVALLGHLFRFDRFVLACLALILVRAYEPLASDMRLGNIAAFQFIAVTGLLAVALANRVSPRRALGAVLVAGLALVAFAKLNLALVVVLMALQFLITSNRKAIVAAAVAAASACIVFALVPCGYFHGCGVWVDWYTQVVGPGKEIAGRSVEQGNYSTTRILADLFAVEATGPVVAVVTILVGSLLAAAYRAGRGWKGALAGALRDPGAAASIGITATMAASPLMWLHYYVWSLIPAFWLMRAGGADARVAALGAAAVLLSSGALNVLLALAGLVSLVPAVMAASWVPLWAGVVLQITRSGDTEDRPEAADSRDVPAARAGGRQRRLRRSIRVASAGGNS